MLSSQAYWLNSAFASGPWSPQIGEPMHMPARNLLWLLVVLLAIEELIGIQYRTAALTVLHLGIRSPLPLCTAASATA